MPDHIRKSAHVLGMVLSDSWCVETFAEWDGHAAVQVPLTGHQLEQLVLSLGVAVAESAGSAGTLLVRATSAKGGDAEGECLLIEIGAAAGPEPVTAEEDDLRPALDDAGAVACVVRSLLEEVGGRLDIISADQGLAYRMSLPTLRIARERVTAGIGIPPGLRDALKGCRILVAHGTASSGDELELRLRAVGAEVRTARDLGEALVCIDREQAYDGLVWERNLLGDDATGLLKAVTKLQPAAGLVVLSREPETIDVPDPVIPVPASGPPEEIITALCRSRERARRGQLVAAS